jgi:hypothetical protein
MCCNGTLNQFLMGRDKGWGMSTCVLSTTFVYMNSIDTLNTDVVVSGNIAYNSNSKNIFNIGSYTQRYRMNTIKYY